MIHLLCEQNSALWDFLKMRGRTKEPRISATQVSSAIGLGGSTRRLLESKRGPPNWKLDDLSHIAAIKHGQDYENTSIQKAREVLDPNSTASWLKPAILMDWTGEPVTASPDAMFFRGNRMMGLEVKTPFSSPLPLNVDKIKMEYLVQVFTCLSVSRASCWYLFFYEVSTNRAVLFVMHPQPELWKQQFLPRIHDFLKLLESPEPNPVKRDKGELNFLKKKLRSKVQRLSLWQSRPVPRDAEPEICASRDDHKKECPEP